jgi:hypothetical protein
MITETEAQRTPADLITNAKELRQQVQSVVRVTPVIDIHTHVFPPMFGDMCLSGIDDLLCYHYLIAEVFRSTDVSYACFWKMSKFERADLIWRTLFVENTPISEATLGVVSVLDEFGLDSRARDLKEARDFFNSRNLLDQVDCVLATARVSDVVMTNDPLDEIEAETWRNGGHPDRRFHASLRLDSLLNDWPDAARILASQGLHVNTGLSGSTIAELRRFLDNWITRMRPLYLAISLPADFKFPDENARDRLIHEVVLPTAKQHDLALTLMVGVRRGVNPTLRAAGDGVGKADVTALERLCAENPEVRFLATFLSRENQHELCVAARKFNNLMPFGCWWFLNNPSIASEITRARLELLGPTFIPQHSDASVLEQLIYKWRHARQFIADALCESYEKLLKSGRAVTCEEIERDVSRMFSGNFRDWVGVKSSVARIEFVS